MIKDGLNAYVKNVGGKMGRFKVAHRAENISISLPYEQIQFIKNHYRFSLSDYVRIHLQEYIALTEDVENIEREEGIKHDEKIIE